MTTIIENWTLLSGEILTLEPWTKPGKLALGIKVNEVQDVAGEKNLLSNTAGTTLTVVIAEDIAKKAGAKPGKLLKARVSRGRKPNIVFADTIHFQILAN